MRRFKKSVWSLFESFKEFVYPSFCLLCLKRSERYVCKGCWSRLPRAMPPVLPSEVLEARLSFDHSLAVFGYKKDMKKLVHVFKYKNLPGVIHPLASELRRYFDLYFPEGSVDVFIPIPLNKVRLRERGYNQAQLIADCLSKDSGIPVSTQIVKRIRHTHPQASMTREERIENIRGAFRVERSDLIQQKRIGLVDDVLTTGHTIHECGRVLLKAGASHVYAITLARVH